MAPTCFSVRRDRPDLMTRNDVAAFLGCSLPYIRRLVSAGLLSERRVGRAWPRYLRSEVEVLLDRSTTKAATG
jgi:excisionase family DNA binding protein